VAFCDSVATQAGSPSATSCSPRPCSRPFFAGALL